MEHPPPKPSSSGNAPTSYRRLAPFSRPSSEFHEFGEAAFRSHEEAIRGSRGKPGHRQHLAMEPGPCCMEDNLLREYRMNVSSTAAADRKHGIHTPSLNHEEALCRERGPPPRGWMLLFTFMTGDGRSAAASGVGCGFSRGHGDGQQAGEG